MEYIPVHTRIMRPPKDDLFSILDESLSDVREGDIVCISSKVLAIHQGRCVPLDSVEKMDLITQEADMIIERDYQKTPLTIKQNVFIGSAGIDESNANGYYVLMPEKLFEAAQELHSYMREKFAVKQLGIIITDSRSLPLRYGATGVSLAFWGFSPLLDHRGKRDLFGREMQLEKTNLADGIAAGANVVAGEVAEGIPVVIARGVPEVTYTDVSRADELFVPIEQDIFRALYKNFLKE